MQGLRKCSLSTRFTIWTLLFSSLSLLAPVATATDWITFTTDEGTVYLDNDRRPALYTGDFGDCEGDSLINVTHFDASLYRDNMTVKFHIEGTTALLNEKVMMYLSVFAYGENRFSLMFNPCTIDTPSLCPINASQPIVANGLLPIGPSDLAGVPSIAFGIPDFEGQAILRIFSNTTQSQIACYSAVMSNGASFSHPAAVGSVLGIFALIALVSSVAVAIYGHVVPETRKHYAHSMSVFVVFSVLQHIFFTGALSVNWPSVLVAFWSNYGWAAGMIYSRKMQNSINQFIGSNFGNISAVGSAPSNQNFANLGGGYDLSQLYKRNTNLESSLSVDTSESIQVSDIVHTLQRRALGNTTSGATWYGGPVTPGLPLPGNYSSFAGTLSELNIPASNAFLTGLLWLLILIAIVAASMVALKWIIEALAAMKVVKTDRLGFFRKHWLQFTGAAILRTCYIAFFMILFLALFQLTLGGAKGAIVLAAVIFALFFLGLFGTAAYALWYRLRSDKYKKTSGHLRFWSKKHGSELTHDTTLDEQENTDKVLKSTSVPSLRIVDPEDRPHVHDDIGYTTKFGWMASRFRRSKWWFFSAWLVYELVRACFYGGAAGHALTQVFGLLAWEILSLAAIVIMRPFESSRLNLVMVYFLGFSKVVTVALSSAFDPRFNLGRILCTVIGIIIIIIQGLLTICLMIAIVIGAISSYMSVTRYHEEFKPKSWEGMRTRYFAHVDLKNTDKPAPPPPPPPPEPEKPKDPYFAVTSVRREMKIEDEGPTNEAVTESYPSRISVDPELDNCPMSSAHSIRSRTSASNLPFGARQHRASWSVKDFQELDSPNVLSPRQSRMSLDGKLHPRNSVDDLPDLPTPRHHRSQSLIDAANPDSRPLTPRTTDVQASRSKRQRGYSTPHKPRKPHDSFAEDVENDEIHPISAKPKA